MPMRGAALCLIAFGLVGCVDRVEGSPGPGAASTSPAQVVLATDAVARDIAVQFEAREGVAVALVCADAMVVVLGATYGCEGTTAAGEDIALELTITDEATAAYTWTEP